VGVALRRGYWTFESDFQWMMWSKFDQVSVTYLNAPAFDTTLPQGWQNTWRGAIGAEYLIKDDWEVRGGYSYDHSPAPTETISPFIHDADRHSFGLGGTYKYEKLRLDFNLRYLLWRTSSTLGISRYGYDGDYSSHSLQFGAAIGYRF
jgi:long-chain fatty acid transport protein